MKLLRFLYVSLVIVLGYLTIVASCRGTPCCTGIRFTDMENGTVRDECSGLIWLKDANVAQGQTSWMVAVGLASLMRHGVPSSLSDGSAVGDWRLPTKSEWEEFVDKTYANPALCNATGDGQWAPGDAFYGVQSNNYWSSSLDGAYIAWIMSMGWGEMYFVPIIPSTHYVWPVRFANASGD
jgi:hypothetical protein